MGFKMKLSELWDYVEASYDAFGDLECYMDIGDDEMHEITELVCEFNEDDNSRRMLLLNFELPELETENKPKRSSTKMSLVK